MRSGREEPGTRIGPEIAVYLLKQNSHLDLTWSILRLSGNMSLINGPGCPWLNRVQATFFCELFIT